MRTDTCLYCDALFQIRPAHPAWERSSCDGCYRIVAPLWNMGYVSPADVRRALGADDV